jgi:hypothetical protein
MSCGPAFFLGCAGVADGGGASGSGFTSLETDKGVVRTVSSDGVFMVASSKIVSLPSVAGDWEPE